VGASVDTSRAMTLSASSHGHARPDARPVSGPVVDFAQELWQFSHMTYSFVLRVSIAAALVAYGMITGFLMHDLTPAVGLVHLRVIARPVARFGWQPETPQITNRPVRL
jgi:hypothetical protein